MQAHPEHSRQYRPCKLFSGSAMRAFSDPEHNFLDYSLPKHATPDQEYPEAVIRPSGRALVLLRELSFSANALRAYRQEVNQSASDELAAELTHKVAVEAAAFVPVTGGIASLATTEAQQQSRRFIAFIQLHFGKRTADAVSVPDCFHLSPHPPFSATYQPNVNLPDGSVLDLPADTPTVSDQPRKSLATSTLKHVLLHNPSFIEYIISASPSARARAALSHDAAFLPQPPLNPANPHAPLTWIVSRPRNWSRTYYYHQLFISVNAARVEKNWYPIRTRSDVRFLSSIPTSGYVPRLFVYIGLQPNQPLAVIYSATPSTGYFPTIQSADEAICKAFFASGSAHRMTLLGGPDFTFPGIAFPFQTGPLMNNLLINADGHQSDPSFAFAIVDQPADVPLPMEPPLPDDIEDAPLPFASVASSAAHQPADVPLPTELALPETMEDAPPPSTSIVPSAASHATLDDPDPPTGADYAAHEPISFPDMDVDPPAPEPVAHVQLPPRSEQAPVAPLQPASPSDSSPKTSVPFQLNENCPNGLRSSRGVNLSAHHRLLQQSSPCHSLCCTWSRQLLCHQSINLPLSAIHTLLWHMDKRFFQLNLFPNIHLHTDLSFRRLCKYILIHILERNFPHSLRYSLKDPTIQLRWLGHPSRSFVKLQTILLPLAHPSYGRMPVNTYLRCQLLARHSIGLLSHAIVLLSLFQPRR